MNVSFTSKDIKIEISKHEIQIQSVTKNLKTTFIKNACPKLIHIPYICTFYY
jgi:hypothetical protein